MASKARSLTCCFKLEASQLNILLNCSMASQYLLYIWQSKFYTAIQCYWAIENDTFMDIITVIFFGQMKYGLPSQNISCKNLKCQKLLILLCRSA